MKAYGPFQMMGFLSSLAGGQSIVPLYGRHLYGERYQYYTESDNGIKVPIKIKGEREIDDGSTIDIKGMEGSYRVNMYDYGYWY